MNKKLDMDTLSQPVSLENSNGVHGMGGEGGGHMCEHSMFLVFPSLHLSI